MEWGRAFNSEVDALTVTVDARYHDGPSAPATGEAAERKARSIALSALTSPYHISQTPVKARRIVASPLPVPVLVVTIKHSAMKKSFVLTFLLVLVFALFSPAAQAQRPKNPRGTQTSTPARTTPSRATNTRKARVPQSTNTASRRGSATRTTSSNRNAKRTSSNRTSSTRGTTSTRPRNTGSRRTGTSTSNNRNTNPNYCPPGGNARSNNGNFGRRSSTNNGRRRTTTSSVIFGNSRRTTGQAGSAGRRTTTQSGSASRRTTTRVTDTNRATRSGTRVIQGDNRAFDDVYGSVRPSKAERKAAKKARKARRN